MVEQHITADIALAQWQYYVATGDRQWLRQQGWPVLSGAAAFWASRVTLGSDGQYHITGVTGPDEENPDVNDEVYASVAAKTTLEDALQAANILGVSAPASWSEIASNIAVLTDPSLGIHPEFSGYGGQLVKQADVTLRRHRSPEPSAGRCARRRCSGDSNGRRRRRLTCPQLRVRSPPCGPAATRCRRPPTAYLADDRHLSGRTAGTLDVLHFAPTRARFIRISITSGTGSQPPMLQELQITS
ncbi:MAG: hypothetical protein WBP81_14870 [Solirubrobacteraceae bacterium]